MIETSPFFFIGTSFEGYVDCNIAGAKLSPYVPREGQGPPPPPEWKKRDYIRDILPDRDPHAEIVKASPPEN